MINRFFTCPYCNKETSYWFEPVGNSIIFAPYSVGFGCISKKSCDYCKEILTINWLHYFLSYLILALILLFLWISGKAIYLHAIPENFKEAAPVFGFFIFLPVAVLIFYVIVPAIVGLTGLRLYLKKQ